MTNMKSVQADKRRADRDGVAQTWYTDVRDADAVVDRWRTPAGISFLLETLPFVSRSTTTDVRDLLLHQEHARLGLLRGFDELLCLEGLRGVEQLPHQIETVRKVLRHFHGRVLLADEVGLGKTIEACLLLREYLLRGMARRVLILVPSPLVSQWHEELDSKFDLQFRVATRASHADRLDFWTEQDRVLASLAFAKGKKRAEMVAARPWDLVIVDEAHHCKNRATLNWQLINALQRRFMFLLTATPVQNNLVELYNLLTLLAPGHLRTEQEFKKQYVKKGNPRDPRNRARLRGLLGEVMIRNTRSLVQLDLPPRFAQTIVAKPGGAEAELYRRLTDYLRIRGSRLATQAYEAHDEPPMSTDPPDVEPPSAGLAPDSIPYSTDTPIDSGVSGVSRLQLSSLLAAQGSHPVTVAASLDRIADRDPQAAVLAEFAKGVERSAKDVRLLEVLQETCDHKVLIFVNFLRTLHHVEGLLTTANVPYAVFSGQQSADEKDQAVELFRQQVPVMLCTESGGEGRNLQFADTLINYDLPWNPMRIEQRIGRIHRYGQKRDVFIFNMCTAGSIEARILRVLDEKIRMFELVVGEVGSILGNLEEGDQFESIVFDMWLRSRDDQALDQSFLKLGDTLLEAQAAYLDAKELDDALFGEDFQ